MPHASSQSIRVGRLVADLDTLARFGLREDGGGIDRPAFSQAYRQAADWLIETMREAGMSARMDSAGNIIGRLGPTDGPAVVCGSHIDSVPTAGKYDGTLGVLAGLEVARCLSENNIDLDKAYEVIAFMDEEGAFLGEFGARAMIGDFNDDEFEDCLSRDGTSLLDAIKEFGLDSSKICDAVRSEADFDAYVELHIEQGPVLENEGVDIGIVESIVGLQINELNFEGQANHAGTTPLPYRRDAFRAAAETVTTAFKTLEGDFPPDLRLTYGVADVSPGAQNVVPSHVRLIQEIRAGQEYGIDAACRMTMQVAERICKKYGVKVGSRLISRDPTARMSDRVSGLVEAVCLSLELKAKRMPSGAGHDAQILAQVCDAGMIFVPSAGGISHNPAEHTSVANLGAGAAVLYETLLGLLEAA